MEGWDGSQCEWPARVVGRRRLRRHRHPRRGLRHGRVVADRHITDGRGIGAALAQTIERELTGAPVEPTVNLMTGEIVDDAQKDGND